MQISAESNAPEVNELYQDAAEQLRQFLLCKTGNAEQADEIAQDTCTKLFRLNHYRDIHHQRCYLFNMAVRLAVSALGRRQSAGGRRPLGNVSETQLDSDAGEAVAYRTLVNELQTEAIKNGLIELSDRTRYIFLLHRYRGLSRSRIAEHLGLPATVVDSHIDEAMGSIKHAVSEFSALGVSWRQGH